MPKSKKRRKNGTVVSGKMKNQLSAPDLTPHDDFDDDVWDWIEAQNYAGAIKELAISGVSEDGLIAFLHHLREGYSCAQSGEPWTYVPPPMTTHPSDCNSIDTFEDIEEAQDSDVALDFLAWSRANGYKSFITKLRVNGASASEVLAYLDHLQEGFECTQSGDPWTHIPPIVS